MTARHLVIVAIVFAALWLTFRRRSAKGLQPEAAWRVDFDQTQISVTTPQGERRTAQWQNLTKVGIRTTDEGPWHPDVFWDLHEHGSETPTLVFPGGSTGEDALIKQLYTRLPNLNSEQLIQAMSSTTNATFTLWESPPGANPNRP